ncbi:MAG: hypothetical protein V7699_01480 [Porticoccus sp.]
MSEECYEVIFRGDVLAGQSVIEIKQRLAQLFNAEAKRIDQMFSGKPVVVKRNLDLETAERYQSTLLKAGALVDIRPATLDGVVSEERPVESSNHDSGLTQEAEPEQNQPSQPQEQVLEDVDFDLAPVGADVLSPEDKKDFTSVDVDTSSLTIAETGSDVLADEDKKEFVPQDVDTSSLSIDDPE